LTSLKEIQNSFELNTTSYIWQQKVFSGNAIFSLVYNLLLFTWIINSYFEFFEKGGFIDSVRAGSVTLVDLGFLFLSALLFIFLLFVDKRIRTSIKYSIYHDKINFDWGLFRRNHESIPFDKITFIHQVKYDHGKFSTIYFGSDEFYEIKKLGIHTSEPQANIAFEKVKDGDRVFELLNYLWEKETNKIQNTISTNDVHELLLKEIPI